MKKLYLVPIVVAILGILIGIKIYQNYSGDKLKTAKPSNPLILAECYLARDTVLNSALSIVGNIRANERVEIVSELARRVTAIPFTEGSQVKKGELLFQLDDAEWKASLKKVDAQLELARETEKRDKSLLASGGISQQVFDEAVNQRKVLEAEEESLRVQIEKARIIAPFSGRTGIRNVSIGALVSPGIVLTSLEDLSRLKLDMAVPESFANAIHKGDKVSFRPEGMPTPLTAVVEACDPSINSATGNLRILAVVQSPDPNLIAGTSVTVNLIANSPVPGLYVPTQALIPTPAGYIVYSIEKGLTKVRKVKTGMRTEKMVEITGGIQKGDTILVTGFMKVKPDAKVKIIKTW